MPSVTSYEVAQLRTAFHALHTDYKLRSRTPISSQESSTSTAAGFPFEKNEAELSDLLARVKAKEIEVMDTITLKSLAAMQTHEYDQYVSLLEEKKAELARFSIHLEPKNVSHSVDLSKLAHSTPSCPASSPTTPLKRKRATSTVTPPTSQQMPCPVTPRDRIMSQDHILSVGVAITTTSTVPTITITPPPKTPPSCTAPQQISSSPKKLPVLGTWSTQSPKKPETKLPIENSLQPVHEFGTKAIHHSPKKKFKPAAKPLANSQAKNVKPKSKVTKSPTAPTRRNPQRNPHTISRKIANVNIHTLSLPEFFETIDGTEYGDGFAFFTNKTPVITPQLIWSKRFPAAMSTAPFPDLPPGMSARALGNTLADYTTNALKSMVASHPDEDLETTVTTLVSGIHHVLERIAMVAEQTAVVINGDMPVGANNAKTTGAEKRPNSIREDAKAAKIEHLESQIESLKKEITYFVEQEKRYGAIMDDNELLKEEVAALKDEVEEWAKEGTNDVDEVKGELRDTKLQLEAALRKSTKVQKKVRDLERGTGKSIDEMLITMQAALEKNANADIDDGHYDYEDDDINDLLDDGLGYGFAAPFNRKRKAASE